MRHVTQNGASFSTDFVRGFKKPEAFIKAMEGHVPGWTGDDRNNRLKSVWSEANGKPETKETVTESETVSE